MSEYKRIFGVSTGDTGSYGAGDIFQGERISCDGGDTMLDGEPVFDVFKIENNEIVELTDSEYVAAQKVKIQGLREVGSFFIRNEFKWFFELESGVVVFTKEKLVTGKVADVEIAIEIDFSDDHKHCAIHSKEKLSGLQGFYFMNVARLEYELRKHKII